MILLHYSLAGRIQIEIQMSEFIYLFDLLCTAPGNKTSHLASLVYTHAQQDYDKHTVFAFDKSEARSKLLSDRMIAAGNTHYSPMNVTHFVLLRREDSHAQTL
jgi:16S rRNA C967 or C1407 C5-methylase (RsmB/RsmF family)